MKICVAVSGGRDSMALLNFFRINAEKYGITLFAVNCNHQIRGEASDNDTAFVKEWCKANNIALMCFTEDCLALAHGRKVSVETAARDWRRSCFYIAAQNFACDAVATAHHADDNAESVLFNLARGSALSGVQGIRDGEVLLPVTENGQPYYHGEDTKNTVALNLIHPLIACTRDEINVYVKENNIPYVDDESNADDNYTRNKIRLNIMPQLEKAVPGAVNSIYRFSRLVAETEDYFDKLIEEKGIVSRNNLYIKIALCEEDALFGRAVHKVLQDILGKKDYTYEHIRALKALRYAENGKKFEFLHLTAYRENDGIAICEEFNKKDAEIAFKDFNCGIFGGIRVKIVKSTNYFASKTPFGKPLKFDLSCVPDNAVVRFRKEGDKFNKFGGGTKNLGDFLTDKKIPVFLRDKLPVIAVNNEILAICGVEISEKIKITEKTKEISYIICEI